MRKALLGLFAASLVIAAFTVFNMMRRSDASVPSQHILAASVALPAGTLLRAQDVTWNAVIEADADQFVRPSTAEVQAKPESVQETEASLYGAVLRHALGAGA